MGYSEGEVSEREWMPSVDAFFGRETGTVLGVMPPSDLDTDHHDEDFDIGVPSPTEEELHSVNSATNVNTFRENSCSIKSSCLDPPTEEDASSSEASHDTPNVDQLAGRCFQLELMNDALKKKLEAHGDEGNVDIKDWLHFSADFAFTHTGHVRSKHGTFDDLRQTWETQRDLLIKHLKEKDEVIRKQNAQLVANQTALNQMAAGIDGLESRFECEVESYRLKLVQDGHRSQQRADTLMLAGELMEEKRCKLREEMTQLSSKALSDMRSLESVLEQHKALISQSEQEKKSVVTKLDLANEELSELRHTVTQLEEDLSTEKAKVHHLRQQRDALRDAAEEASPVKEVCSLYEGAAERQRARDIETQRALIKENAELKRQVVDMREELLDFKEHAQELESQVRKQQTAFHQSCSQLHELEILRATKQDLVALLSTKQKNINGLKQSLCRLHSEMCQSTNATSSAELRFIEEVLAAQIRCEETESLLINAQTERDLSTEKIHRLSDAMQSMQRDAKKQARSFDRLKKDYSELKKTTDCQKSEIATLQANLRIESLKSTSDPHRRMRSYGEVDGDVMKELLKSKLAAAELSELVIQLRHELSSFKASSNNPTTRTNHGYHLIKRTLEAVRTR